MPRVTKSDGWDVYSVRAGHNDMEWATIVIRGWQQPGNDGTPREIGEILIHSSYGSWAYQWGHLGQPFKLWLAHCDDPHYVAEKFLGTKAREFDGDKTVAELRRQIIGWRKRGRFSKCEAREAWDWIDENEGDLVGDEGSFVGRMMRAASELTAQEYGSKRENPIVSFFEEPWERICRSLNASFQGFWREIMPTFQRQLQAELEAAA